MSDLSWWAQGPAWNLAYGRHLLMIWGPGSKRAENEDDRDKGKKRHLLIQPRGEKCLMCARTVAKRTLGKVEVEDNKQASWCRSEHPKSWGSQNWL